MIRGQCMCFVDFIKRNSDADELRGDGDIVRARFVIFLKLGIEQAQIELGRP
jgi:hypothetical protein